MLYGSDQTTCHSLPEEEPQATPTTVPVSYVFFLTFFLRSKQFFVDLKLVLWIRINLIGIRIQIRIQHFFQVNPDPGSGSMVLMTKTAKKNLYLFLIEIL